MSERVVWTLVRTSGDIAKSKHFKAKPTVNDDTPQPQPAPADPLAALQAENETLRQKWLLAQADLDNYRKRMQKELEQERLYRSLPLARDLLNSLDDLRRALDAARSASDVAQLAQGVQIVLQQIETIFANHSIKPIESVGNPFDPNLHQAVQQVPTQDQPPNTVVSEFQKGYLLHDRVIRPAAVIVAAPPAT